jgi:hypothetical protein
MVQPARPEKSAHDDLPAYLTEPTAARRSVRELRDDLSRALQRNAEAARATGAPAVPFGGRTPRLSPTFSRMVVLHRNLLPAALDAWWTARQKTGSVRIYHRLQLRLPQGDVGSGWRMEGRVRRLTTLRWIPVVVELWPMYDDFTMMTMTPQRRVLATRRYFRLGHAVLDRLWAELAARETPSPTAPSPRRRR